MIRCNTGQNCRYSWSSMQPTGDRNVRHCPQCQQPVHWVGSYNEFKQAAQHNRCIAFEPADVLLTAEHAQTTQAERKQFLLLEKQKLSLKQLAHVKRYIHPDWSFRELRESYHNKASIIKYDPNKSQDVDTVASILRGLGIKVDVKREETV